MVQRFDIGELQKPTRMGNGWLRVDGFLTRAGVFTYRNPDGTTRRELRPEDEVFKADSLASFGLVPLTNDHPPEALTAKNTKSYAVGTVGDTVKRDSDHVRATLLVTDADAIAKAEGGKTALSCGYVCDLDATPGIHNGERYDAIQRNIRGNHVALVDVARAGPNARIRMDAGDAEMIPNEPSTGLRADKDDTMTLVTMRIDGIDVETTPIAKQAFEKAVAAASARADGLQKELDAAKADATKATAKADGLAAELVKEKARADAADAPARVQAAVKARVALETQAAKHLGAAVKLDAMDDHAIRVAVIEKLDGVKLDAEKAKSPVYVEARFDGALARTAKESPALDDARRNLNAPPTEADRNDAGLGLEEKARRNMNERLQNAHKRPEPKA